LFFNSLEFIQKNQPRYFMFENVKGLLSDDKVDKKAEFGRTFQEWINYLGGKSVNGVHTFFPYEDSVPYHIYFQVLNAKEYGVPQNRERIFIIGIRDDEDNTFIFPKTFPLEKRLKDVLEPIVDDKYFLSEKMLEYFESRADNFNSGKVNFKNEEDVASAITRSSSSLDISDNILKLESSKDYKIAGDLNKGGERGVVFDEDSRIMNCLTATDYKQPKQIKVGTWRTHEDGKGFRETEDNCCPTIPARAREDGSGQPVIKISEPLAGAIRGRNEENPKSRKKGIELTQIFEKNEDPTISNTITTVNKDNVLLVPSATKKGYEKAEEEDSINLQQLDSETRRCRVGKGIAQTLDTSCNQGVWVSDKKYDSRRLNETLEKHDLPEGKELIIDSYNKSVSENMPCLTARINARNQTHLWNGYKIRRLTPKECLRLMDFSEASIDKILEYNLKNPKKAVSDSQLYKQAGNSIVVKKIELLTQKINLNIK
jgi:site-specific DNA-cytosine methylase